MKVGSTTVHTAEYTPVRNTPARIIRVVALWLLLAIAANYIGPIPPLYAGPDASAVVGSDIEGRALDAPTQTGFSDLAVGNLHSCAVTDAGAGAGEVVCWGANLYGQLGDGTNTMRLAPVMVDGLANVVEVVAGEGHSCALRADGLVFCWGRSIYGELGAGSGVEDSSTPVMVADLTGVTQLFGGYTRTCAITGTDDFYCWGSGDSAPVLMEELAGVTVTSVAFGAFHSCVLTDAGAVYCEGSNQSGQLGDGNEAGALGEYLLVNGIGATAVAVGAGADYSCAATATGVRCWGENGNGQLGDNSFTDRDTPGDVINANPAGSLAGSAFSTCAVTASGGVQCWGRNTYGQLGDGTTSLRRSAVDVADVDNVTAVGMGEDHACALTSSGAIRCWGSNVVGQLGIDVNARPDNPVEVVDLGGSAVALGLGEEHSCAVLDSGALKCWGNNGLGRLGNGSVSSSNVPIAIPRLVEGVAGVAAGGEHTCAFLTTGAAKCWGRNSDGQVGDGSESFTQLRPEDVVGLTAGVGAMSLGARHTCAIVDSDVQCWGRNTSGMLGDGTFAESNVPVMLEELGEVVDLTTGPYTSCVVNAAGEMYCWGENTFGQVGNDSTGATGSPARVQGLSGTPQAGGGGQHFTCALLATGNVDCWGVNNQGQLGDGSYTNRRLPAPVVGLDGGATALAVGGDHACVLMDDATVRCWGNTQSKQLANSTVTNNSNTPVEVENLADVTAIAAGDDHTCAIVAGGSLKCWGANFLGQLGDGTAWSVSAVAVGDPDTDPNPDPGDTSRIFLPSLAR